MKKLTLIALATILSACSMLQQKTVSGTYQGTLPCADCEKIEAKLELNNDGTYQYSTIYHKNKEQHPFIEKGTYSWDANKSGVIRLINSDNIAIKVADTYAEFCDASGNTINSKKLNYKLQKVVQ
ncbi:hypothetical protein BMT54_04575 [Pasteurellaceae bacterium 15-036681]|nr:hypothetical protein BMT54_04575 [Pasteurellaceae bacterium 15-036681]